MSDNKAPTDVYECNTHAEIFGRLNKVENMIARMQGALGLASLLMIVFGAFVLQYLSTITEVNAEVIRAQTMIQSISEDVKELKHHAKATK